LNFNGFRYSFLQKLSSKRQFRENQLGDNHTSLKGVNEVLSYCVRFSSDLNDIRYNRRPQQFGWFWVPWKL